MTIIDLESAFNDKLQAEIEEDNHKYSLQNKPSLIKKFISYRLCTFILQAIEKNNKNKTVFYFNENMNVVYLSNYLLFIKLTLQRLSKILSYNIYYNTLSINDLNILLENGSGESKELKNRLYSLIYREKKLPNMTKFNRFLEKNGIHRIDNNPLADYKIRLGLFIA